MDTSTVKANLYEFFRLLRTSPQAKFSENDGLLRWHTTIPHPWFSGILCTRPPDDQAGQAIQEALDYFSSHKVGTFTWWLDPDLDSAAWSQHLIPRGFQYTNSPPAMAVDLAALPVSIPHPASLSICQVNDLETLLAWTRTFIPGYELPENFIDPFYDLFADVGVDLPIRHYLGYMDGKPVATSTLFLGAGTAGIYDVGTLPEARRQGIGAALTLYPLQQARAMGYKSGILQSSEMGFGVYQRLGFRHVGAVDHFYWQAEEG